MSKPEEGGNGKEHGVERINCPTLHVTFDPRTYQVALGGSVPNWPFARFMLLEALTACEEKIQAGKNAQRIELPGPLIFGAPTKGG